jgi:hypothetical protein
MSLTYLKKLSQPYIWKRIFYERLSEPIHLNVIALFVSIFGSYRTKIDFDLVIRPQHAYSLLSIADQAKSLGHDRVSVFEFGVAAGSGLINLQEIAKKITQSTGIKFDIYGFDTGAGMPPPQSYKDHPEIYQAGDFPMDFDKLSPLLDQNTKLVIGPIAESMKTFLAMDFSKAPIGFISIDVDYYSSTVDALKLLTHSPENMLPQVMIYLDDLEYPSHNSWCGEQAAVHEFTAEHPMRPIEKHPFLRSYRIFKNARWIDHMYQCHVLDHAIRNQLKPSRSNIVLTNPYL